MLLLASKTKMSSQASAVSIETHKDNSGHTICNSNCSQ